MTNVSVSSGAAALTASAPGSASNAATAEGFGKAMRAAEALQGITLGTGRLSSVTPGPSHPIPTGPTPLSASPLSASPHSASPHSPNGTSLPLWDTAGQLGHPSRNGTSAAESALVGGAAAELTATDPGAAPAAGSSNGIAGNLLLIQQLTQGTTVAAGPAADGEAGSVVADKAASATGGQTGAGQQVVGNLLLIQAQPATAGTAAGTPTAPGVAQAGGTTAAADPVVTGGQPATGSSSAGLAALAGAPGATNGTANGATNGTANGSANGTANGQTVGVPATAVAASAGTASAQVASSQTASSQTTSSQAASAQTTSQPAPGKPVGQPVSVLPGVLASSANPATFANPVASRNPAVQAAATAAATAATAKAANAANGQQDQTTAPLQGPQSAGAAPSSPVTAPAPAAPAQHTPLASQVGKPMLHLASLGKGEHTVTLNVSPDNLGQVTVRAHVGADGIRVDLIAATDSGREALKSILGDLRRDLASMGGNSSLNLSGDGQPTAFGGRERHEQQAAGAGSGGTGTPSRAEPELLPEPDPRLQGTHHGTSTLDLMA